MQTAADKALVDDSMLQGRAGELHHLRQSDHQEELGAQELLGRIQLRCPGRNDQGYSSLDEFRLHGN
jgi:hypothetical protein